MDVKYCINLERLLEQVITLNPKLSDSPEELSLINKKLEEQLVQGEAVVRVRRMNVTMTSTFDPLADDIEQRIKRLKSMLTTNTNQGVNTKKKIGKPKSATVERVIKVEEFLSDSSDDEALIFKKFGRQVSVAPSCSVRTINQTEENYFLNDDSSLEDRPNFEPLSLRRTPRKRQRSSNFKFENISPIKSRRASGTEHGKYHSSRSYQRQETAISTSGIIHPCEENIIVEQGVTSRSFHIKIPSLFKGAVHELNFCELDISRKVFDARAKEARLKLLQNENKSSQNTKKSHKKKKLIEIDEFRGNTYQQERDDAEISQLINDVIGTSGNEDETWQATNALENINNEVIDNYDVLSAFNSTSPDFIGFERQKSPKRHYIKSSKSHSNEENKKRGRKPKFKTKSISQPPTKSNLAQYVENFSNNCDVMCGSTTPATSSTMSQQLVSSTTQNFELIEPQQTSPVMFYFDGNWANGGPCQLVTANGMPLDATQIQSTDLGNTEPFQETDLDGNISLPIITQLQQFQQTASIQNAMVSPVINIQIPKLPTTTTTAACNVAPPPAHITPGVLDLSLKSNINISNTSSEAIQQDMAREYEISIEGYDNEAIPLDLSANAKSNHNDSVISLAQQNSNDLSESLCILEDNGQDDDFIRCLIETSDFDLGFNDLGGENDDSKSFKAALDMPLLESTAENCDVVLNDSTTALQNDSTYASMNENTSNYLNCTFDEDYQFVDQSTKEIFNQLLEIGDKTATNNNDIDNTGNPSDEATFHSDASIPVETDNNCQKDDKKNKSCPEDNSDMMMKETDSTVNTDNNTNNNRMAVMKWVPRILKRRHIEVPTKQFTFTASTPKKIDCSDISTSSKIKYGKTSTTLQSEKIGNENKVRIFRSDRKKVSTIDSDNSYSVKEQGEIVVVAHPSINNGDFEKKTDWEKAKDLQETNELEEPSPLEEANGHNELKVVRETRDNGETKVQPEDLNHTSNETLCSTHTTNFERERNDGCNHLGEAKVHDEVTEIKEVIFLEERMDTSETEDLDHTSDQAQPSTHTTNMEISCIIHPEKDIYETTVLGESKESTNAQYNEEEDVNVVATLRKDIIDINEATVLGESKESTNANYIEEAKGIKEDINAVATVRKDITAVSNVTGNEEAVNKFPENIGFEQSISKTANGSIEVIDIYELNNCDKNFDVPKNNDGTIVDETTSASISSAAVTNLQNETNVADTNSLQKCNNSNERQKISYCAPINLNDSVNDEFISTDHNSIPTMTSTTTVNLQKGSMTILEGYTDSLQKFKIDEHSNDSNKNLITDLCMPVNIDSIDDLSLNAKMDHKDLQNQKLQQHVTKNDVQNFKISNVNGFDTNCEEYAYESDNTTFAVKEKIVFSMAKINLNDETTNLDYLFLSDSDNSSRKSCDEVSQCNTTYDGEMQLQAADYCVKTTPNELIKEEEEDVFPSLILSGSDEGGEINEVDSSECDLVQKECNVSKNEKTATEENSSDHIVTNEEIGLSLIEETDVDMNKDISIAKNHLKKMECNSECDENQNSVAVKKSEYPELHMSLLEMESKLDEDTLNFEDDDDLDALILDTSSSCFDSPNEDRFKDSLVNETIETTNVHVPLTSSVATDDTIHLEKFTVIDATVKVDVPKLPSLDSIIRAMPSSSSSLISFKIPKLNISSEVTTKPNQQQINEVSKIRCASVPNIYDIKMQPYVKLTKIAVREGCRINVKDFNEMIRSSNGVIDKMSQKFHKITRTIINESGVAGKIGIPEQLQTLPKFRSTFRNITAIVRKEQHQSVAARLNGAVASQVGTQQPRHILQPNVNVGPSGGDCNQETAVLPFPCQSNLKCIVKNISADVNNEPIQVTNGSSNTEPSNVGCVIRQTCTTNGIQEIAHIFGVTCLPHLVNECIAPTHCQKCHQFNGNDVVFHTLKSLDKKQLNVAYSFMYSHSKLFGRYFVVFCNVLCLHKDRDKLLNMINDCERYPEYGKSLMILYDSLIKSGLSPSNACRQLLKRTRDRSVPIIDALVAVIMKSDWTMFSDYIECFTHEMYKYNYRMGILEQMAPAVLNSSKQQVHLKNIFFKCVQTLHCDDVPSLCACSSSLMQCLALMATTGNG